MLSCLCFPSFCVFEVFGVFLEKKKTTRASYSLNSMVLKFLHKWSACVSAAEVFDARALW